MSLANGPPQLPYPKLPFSSTVRLSYSSYFRNLADLLRVAWPALLLVTAVAGLTKWQQGPEAFGDFTAPPSFWAVSAWLRALLLIDTTLTIVVAVSIAVTWHRLIILKEPPSLIGRNVATINFWRYVVISLVLGALGLVPVMWSLLPIGYILPASLIANMNIHSENTLLVLTLGLLVAYCVSAVIIARLCLLLPASAVGRGRWPIREAWERTRGNVWRLFWGLVFTTLPLHLAAKFTFGRLVGYPIFARNAGADLEENLAADLILTMIGSDVLVAVVDLLILPISIGFLSYAYQHFFEHRPAQPT
ncbi:hypothetical protein HAP47_0017530 [Bradyrhizobium sp. 41S5]|uniref:hypothetical protein n=1 Tax=Bradyrhizobium sp. 41S5 TaxID=1404443 RepID=UPI00156B6B56|nr:hypothetical protein [Bradyrhizobium sp. 41S5]UFX48354.1 hypothetical protein HAP47_0017530 [Bradyrhizobium sp. 41S5]